MNGERLLACIKQCIMPSFQPMIYNDATDVIETPRGKFSVPSDYREHKPLAFAFVGHLLNTDSTPLIEKGVDWPDPAVVYNTIVDRIINHPELAHFVSVGFMSVLKDAIGQGLDPSVKDTLGRRGKGIRRPKGVYFKYMESSYVNNKVTAFFSFLRDYQKIVAEYHNNTKFVLQFSCKAYWPSGPNFAALKNVIRNSIVHEYISRYVEDKQDKNHIEEPADNLEEGQEVPVEEQPSNGVSDVQDESNSLTEQDVKADEELWSDVDLLCMAWQSETEDEAEAKELAERIVGKNQRIASLKLRRAKFKNILYHILKELIQSQGTVKVYRGSSFTHHSIKVSLHYEEAHITAVWVYLTVKFGDNWEPIDVEVEFRCKFKEQKSNK
ncbi:uncharacterized protein DI49_5676 (plasmid) [Saccharomyces eubayanus]|uniref:uncharacterized protein n=1 Tax=Saccharomyces eubayanus TaxID=1080349 RepID=UPI0006BECA18|nr:hypothetical protein DI49_5676 [Saccharomyces eubayanus]KOG96036.1 hypothetical protein DI49_5676 [Saccharomyces eubayanus]